jgi:hypothetical protein
MAAKPFSKPTLDLHPTGLDSALDYLEHHLPGWPYDRDLDHPFLTELLDDFPSVQLLEQIKLFRWYHDNHAPTGKPRLALRRWIANAKY